MVTQKIVKFYEVTLPSLVDKQNTLTVEYI